MGLDLKRPLTIVALVAILTLFGYLVWPTPYEYLVLAPIPPNSSNSYDFGTAARPIRINRFTGRVWVLSPGLLWQNPGERDEIAKKESGEIKRRCNNAIAAGDFNDLRNRRIVELRGCTFTCP